MCARRISRSETTRARRRRCFREGSRGRIGGVAFREPSRPCGRSNGKAGGFPEGKPVNVCAPDLPFCGRVSSGTDESSGAAMRSERETQRERLGGRPGGPGRRGVNAQGCPLARGDQHVTQRSHTRRFLRTGQHAPARAARTAAARCRRGHHPLATLSVLLKQEIRRAHICRFPSGQPARPPVRDRAGVYRHSL
jgi:hypothetical protein